MSEHSATPDESQSMSRQIKQTVFEGVSVGGDLMVGDVTQTTHVHLPPPPKTEPKHFTVSYPRNPYFTGRSQILTEIHESLGQTSTAALSQAKAIHGLGGVGKTQTAVEYAYRYFYDQSFYEWVLWVDASNLTLTSSFASIATALALLNHQKNKQDENTAAVKHWLEEHDRWLLIFDNVDDPQSVKPFRPNNPKGRILITSRVQRLETLGVAHSIALDTMMPEEAQEFLQRRTERNSIDHSEQQAIVALAEALGYLPLALEQAAAYILAKEVSFAAYLRSYQKKRLQLLEKQKPQMGDYPESVATTWTISFEAVQSNSPAAADLLRLSSFLASDNIPFEILLLGKDHLGESLSTALAEAAEDKLVIPELLEELTRYSLIRLETEDRYSIHRMVQEVLRDTLGEAGQQWRERVVEALESAFPYPPEPENWWQCDRLTEQIQAIEFQKVAQSIKLAELLNRASYFLTDQGRYSEAEPLLLQASEISRVKLGSDHIFIATNLNNLALLYRDQGRYSEAEPLLLQALQMFKALFGENHLDVAGSFNNLATLYISQSRYEEAEPLCKQAVRMFKKLLEENHPLVATSLNALANLYKAQGRYKEAKPLYEQALQIRKISLKKNHPDIAISLSSLAGFHQSQGNYELAEALFWQALKMQKTSLGEDHPDIGVTINNLAGVYLSQRHYERAELLYEQALQIRKISLGENHLDVADSLNNLAESYRRQKRYEEAESLYLQALKIWRISSIESHPRIASIFNNLALLCTVRGRYEEAESYYHQALVILSNHLDQAHPTSRAVWHNFVRLLQQAVEAGRSAELSDHPLTQGILAQLQTPTQ